MLNKWVHLFFFSSVLGLSAQASADNHQNTYSNDADAAQLLLTEAVAYYKKHGQNAFPVFSRQGPFVRDDLYVYVVNIDGVMLASGGPSVMLVGRDVFKNVDDDLQERFQQALNTPETGEMKEGEYPWRHWNTGKRELTKRVFYQRIDDKIIAVGYYTPRANSNMAIQLLDTAAEAIASNSRESFEAINALDRRFYKDDLYVFVAELDSKQIVAHGSDLRMLGRDFTKLPDKDGKPFGRALLDEVARDGATEFDYQWINPINGETELKHAYAKNVGEYFVAVGYYTPNQDDTNGH